MALCDFCNSIPNWLENEHRNRFGPRHATVSELVKSSLICQVCRLILTALSRENPYKDFQNDYNISQEHYSIEKSWNSGILSRSLKVTTPSSKQSQGIVLVTSEQLAEPLYESHYLNREIWTTENPGDPNKRLQVAKDWLVDCLENHYKDCPISESPTLPTRLVHVGDATTILPKVVEFETGETGIYMALSHCWGTASRPLTLTKENFDDMRKAIPLETLPSTFRDAMNLTRILGFQYIWIDSLCIIKDDNLDWERESAKMAAVYENSYLTIAAVASKNPQGGCIQDHEPTEAVHFSVDSDSPRLKKYSTCRVRIESSEQWSMFQSPLYSRGWTLQELILSPRLLLCCRDQLFWQCRTHIYSEDSLVHVHRRFAILPTTTDITGDSMWWKWVEEYSRRSLTDPQDKLAALAGLTTFASPTIKQEPVAGMWAGQLPRDLLWTTPGYAAQTQLLQAPSWSWISVDGPIKMPGHIDMKVQIRPSPKAEVKAVSVSWERQALTSPLAKVQLQLAGLVQEARVEKGTDRESWRFPIVFAGGKQLFDLLSVPKPLPPFGDGFRGIASFDRGPVPIGTVLTCLQIGFTHPKHMMLDRGTITTADHYFLILEQAGVFYRRLGVGYVEIETQEWNEHSRWRVRNTGFRTPDEKLLAMADRDLPNDGSWSGFLETSPKFVIDLI